jgi:hypothetical protein
MNYNPFLYELNTRVWLNRFNQENKKAKLTDIPDEYWDPLINKKFDLIWLMGIWATCDSIIDKYCFEPGLVKSYDRSLKGWKRENVIGSPFAVDVYDINPEIGDLKSLLELKSFLNNKGMKLILDFVPNHFSAASRILKSNPGIFLSVDKQLYDSDPHTFYKPFEEEDKYYAHGRDPFFPAWQDTLQVNFFSSEAREYLTGILLELIKICDGVRCDMAMLALNNVFKNTWGGVLSRYGFEKPQTEFWKEIIDHVKSVRNDFLFIGESYWNLESELHQLGFNYTYDKSFTDKLKSGSVQDIHDHLLAENEYQKKSVRFLENHDEDRAITSFGEKKSKAAAIVINTVPGMRLYHDGQFEGKRIKLPVQLGREPEEPLLNGVKDFYQKLFIITSTEIFKKGEWSLLEPASSWEGNETFKNMLAWSWVFKNDKRLVVINYSASVSSCRLKFDVKDYPKEFEIKDLLNDQIYTRSLKEVSNTGLFIELKPYQSHIFAY